MPTPEEIATAELPQPYYGKTVTGFANPEAWQRFIDTVTEGPKPPGFREERQFPNDRRYVVRLKKDQTGYEIHDNNDPKQGLFYKEKSQLVSGRKLPPHQSVTYYDPKDWNYNPDAFRPKNADEKVIVGVRCAIQHARINRLIPRDTGTFFRPYAHHTQSKATEYLQYAQGNWAETLDKLKKKPLTTGFYNECMVRMSWICHDYSSQILIYTDNIESRILAMMRAHDMERRLQANQALYSQKPYGWTPDYQVPISFWGNSVGFHQGVVAGVKGLVTTIFKGNGIKHHSGCLRLYKLSEQEKDLKQHPYFALHSACKYGCLALIKRLDPAINWTQPEDNTQKTPQTLANEAGHQDIVIWLFITTHKIQFSTDPVQDTKMKDYLSAQAKNRKYSYETVNLVRNTTHTNPALLEPLLKIINKNSAWLEPILKDPKQFMWHIKQIELSKTIMKYTWFTVIGLIVGAILYVIAQHRLNTYLNECCVQATEQPRFRMSH